MEKQRNNPQKAFEWGISAVATTVLTILAIHNNGSFVFKEVAEFWIVRYFVILVFLAVTYKIRVALWKYLSKYLPG